MPNYQIPKLKLGGNLIIASYPGGKSNIKKHLPLYQVVPAHIKSIMEPFAGLANFYFVLSSNIQEAWLNDKNPDVHALLTSIQDSTLLHKLIQWIKSINPIEREDYYDWKPKKPNNILERAVRLLVILNCSPNGAGGGYSHEKAHRKWYNNKPKIWRQISGLLQKVSITNIDYLELLASIPDRENKPDLIYLDPPYFEVAHKGKLYREHNTIEWKDFKQVLSYDNFLE